MTHTDMEQAGMEQAGMKQARMTRPAAARPDGTGRLTRRESLHRLGAWMLAGAATARTAMAASGSETTKSEAPGNWPHGPIRLIVPYPPGGFTDTTARLVAQHLSDHLGKPVIVDNKGGANGIIGVDALAKSAPDGRTFGMVIAAHAANTTLYPKLPYDPKKDLVAVSLVGKSPLVAAASNKAPFGSVRELVDYARSHPDRISYGSSGNGSAVHLTTELFKAATGIRIAHVPYRGAAAMMTDLIAGQIDLALDAASGLVGTGRSGKVRLIGVAGDRRLEVLPDVPTFIEQGFAGFTASTWAGLLAPAGTSPGIVNAMADAVTAVVGRDEVRKRFAEMGTIPVGGKPAEFDAFLASETEKWGRVIREANIKPD